MEQLRKKTCVGLHHCLPEEIMLNIISRLPVDSVLDCRLVCKTWRNLLPPLHDNNTCFADMHLHHHHQSRYSNSDTDIDTKFSFVFLGYNSLFYVEYDANDVQSYLKHKRINLPLPADTQSLVGSCNGLICLCVERKNRTYDPVYICNPVTREFVHLPRFVMDNKHKISVIAAGFGYHPSTNEYKVVRVYYSLDQEPFIGHVQVYTLGSGIGWRNKGEINHTLAPSNLSHGVLLDGALHWLSREGNIVAFDLADEEFRCLPTPSYSFPHRSTICALVGGFCVVNRKTDIEVEIWLLKKKKKKNEEKQSASSNEQCWSWIRNFTIEFDEKYPKSQPFSVTKNGEILLWYKWESIVCCDPELAAKPKKLWDLDKTIIVRQGISHFNSFVFVESVRRKYRDIIIDHLMDSKSKSATRKKISLKKGRSMHQGRTAMREPNLCAHVCAIDAF